MTEGGSYGISGYARARCQAGPSAIDDICNNGGDMAKQAVQKKITSVQCKWGGKGKAAMDLTSGKVLTTVDPDSDTDNASGYQAKLTEYLKKHL